MNKIALSHLLLVLVQKDYWQQVHQPIKLPAVPSKILQSIILNCFLKQLFTHNTVNNTEPSVWKSKSVKIPSIWEVLFEKKTIINYV